MRTKMPAFQEPYIGASPSLQPQHQPVQPPPMSDVFHKRSNTSRSRATSKPPPPPILHQPTPVRDAVHDAFDASAVAQNQLDPELVRQVTEQVIRNLQTVNIAPATPTTSVTPQQTQFPPPPPASSRPPPQPVARSPTQSSTDSIPQRYTPPSPEKRQERDEAVNASPSSVSPPREPSDAGSTYSRDSLRSKASVRSGESSRRPPTEGMNGMRRSNTTASRRRGDIGSDEEKPRRRGSSSAARRDQSRPFRRDSKGSESDYYEPSRSRARPPRIPSDVEETTTLEKIWQPLFENGNPTMRLSQFLRGLALHLIDDYEPKGSLVVTPLKMLRFFNEAKVDDELYPWETIFGGKMSNSSLGKMYCKLPCEHHLVQMQHHELPSVPALTPSGFERFMTHLILAHPENEFERLARAVMNMPISNADNKSERFPKELSRRLLPMQGNIQAEQRIIASLNHEPQVQLRGAVNMPPPPPASAPPQQFTGERERKPYAQTAFSNVVDDDDLGPPPSMPIERERKPYTAKEGAGKRYSNDFEREREGRPTTSQYKPDGPPPTMRSSRSNSNVPTQATYSNGIGSGSSEPMNIPPPRSHRQSMGQGPPPAMLNNMGPMMNGSLPKGRRTPPPRNPYARSSEQMDINNIPPSQFASNLHPGYNLAGGRGDHFTGDGDEDSPRRHHNRRPTDRSNGNTVNEDDNAAGRGYPIPPRPPPSAQGFADYGAASNGIPVGSYPRTGGFSDARRQTWYGAGGGGSGSDGYGSFANGGNGYPSQNTYGSSVQH